FRRVLFRSGKHIKAGGPLLTRRTSGPLLTRKTRRWLHGIALAVFPIMTAMSILTEEMALLYGTLAGTILVPWVALDDANRVKDLAVEEYYRGYNEGYEKGLKEISAHGVQGKQSQD